MKRVKLWLKCYIPCINSLKTCLRVKSDGCKCWKRLKIDRKQFKIVRKAVKRPTWYGFSSLLFNRSFANGEVHSGVRGVKGVKKLRQQPLWLHLLISKHLKTEVRMLAPHALKGQKLLAQGCYGHKQHALKGQKLLAQGNALGYHVRKLVAL